MPVELSHLDDTLPEMIAASRPLAEAHRLDLALFVAFEELSVRIAEALSRYRLSADVLNLLLEQARDDARHLELFRRRLDLSLSSARTSDNEAMLLRVLQGGKATSGGLRRDEIVAAIVTPPLRRYFADCQASADTGAILETLVTFHLVLKGMAWSLCAYEAHYWEPIDPVLAQLIRDSGEEEYRHITRSAPIVRQAAEHRVRLTRLAAESVSRLREAFAYYIRKLVVLFAIEKEQAIQIEQAGIRGVAKILRQAGLDNDGQQESLSHE
jgi:hypothetical protein